ncbi:unnamed protein product [Cylicocyclus nassatus]|uniref:C-type lectin domain-containing protein n=1 Tax=Cylicocyclus nassatus TaxID=53992 RepID=A0AA36H054_CYLNA|nr:unnamed protein product [Cylicocyclus nassatus]
MKLLLLALLALAEAEPNISKQISKSPQLYHNISKAVQTGYCESGWTYYNETDACYKEFFSEPWSSAESLCVTVETHLTSIHSYKENSFIAELTRTNMKLPDDTYATWIGLVRADYLNSNWAAKWMWTDGSMVDFQTWGPKQPNGGADQRCVLIFSDPYTNDPPGLWYRKWNDWHCDSNLRSFVCKKTALHWK